MSVETAIWSPFWYELDQPLLLGEVASFDFFNTPPEYVRNDGLRVFYHGDWHERRMHLYTTELKRILDIRQPTLGSIQAIQTNGLDYRFTMLDGRTFCVNAEEAPGKVEGHVESIDDWRIFVELESV
jgi:hypothetical protein